MDNLTKAYKIGFCYGCIFASILGIVVPPLVVNTIELVKRTKEAKEMHKIKKHCDELVAKATADLYVAELKERLKQSSESNSEDISIAKAAPKDVNSI